MEIVVLAGLYNPTIKQMSDSNLLLYFEQAKSLLNEAVPNHDFNALCKEWRTLAKEEKATIIFAKKDQDVVGVFLGVFAHNACTKEKIFTECHWYVKEEHRQNTGILLYKQAIKIAKAQYCDALIFNTHPDNKTLINFYNKENFKPTNIFYKREI
ncbi:MAG TPA: GNAT family N-acetyltransferase [Elusimicrobiales bacterium]|nr:GNAT family N-acetyltransferase [Elusimicrobiales bacterium]